MQLGPGEGPFGGCLLVVLGVAGLIEFGDDLGGGAAEPLKAGPVPFIDRIGQEVAEHLQMDLVVADGGKRQIQDRALVGEELIGVTDGPVPGTMPGVVHEPADQAFTSPDRTSRLQARPGSAYHRVLICRFCAESLLLDIMLIIGVMERAPGRA